MKHLLIISEGVGDDKNLHVTPSAKKKIVRLRVVKKRVVVTKKTSAKKLLKKAAKPAKTLKAARKIPVKKPKTTKAKVRVIRKKVVAPLVPPDPPEVTPPGPPVFLGPPVEVPVPKPLPATNGNGHHTHNGHKGFVARLMETGKEALGKIARNYTSARFPKGVTAGDASSDASKEALFLKSVEVSRAPTVTLVEKVIANDCASVQAAKLLHEVDRTLVGNIPEVNYVILTMAQLGFTKEPLFVDVMNQGFLTKWSEEHYISGKRLSQCSFDAPLRVVHTPDFFRRHECTALIIATPLLKSEGSYPNCLFVVDRLRNDTRQPFLSTVWINDQRTIPLDVHVLFAEVTAPVVPS